MNFNQALLGGRLTADCELRFTPKGTAVGEFQIAVNRRYKSGEEWKEQVSFIPCTAFGKTAEAISEHFHKGSTIFVSGAITMDEWTDKTTQQKRTKLKVQVDSFQFVWAKDQQMSPTPARGGSAPRKSAPVEDDSAPPF